MRAASRAHRKDRLAVPADRRLRLPVGLPHRRARRLRRLDRVDVPAALRLAVDLRRAARPRRRQLAGGPLWRLRAGRPALHPGHEHDRDDLDDPAGLAAGGRRAHDRAVARQQARLEPHAPADRLRRRPPAGAHRSNASRARCRSRSCASRCSTTAPRRDWSVVDDRRGGRVRAWTPPTSETAFRLFSDIRMGIEGNRAHGRHTMHEGEKRFCAISWTEERGGPHTVEQAEEYLERTATSGARGWPKAPIPTIPGASPAALGAGAEGPDVHAHRRARRGADHLAAGDAPGRAQLGLPLLLDARRDVHAVGLHALGFDWEADDFIQYVADLERNEDGSLQIMYGIKGEKDLTESTLEHLKGYEGARSGADRQRRLQPAPERRLRRGARLGLPALQDGATTSRAAVAGARRPGECAIEPSGRSPTRASGRRAASPSTTSPRS
jgi:hypothetical protein